MFSNRHTLQRSVDAFAWCRLCSPIRMLIDRSGQERIAQHRANVDDQPATLRPLEVGEACVRL